MVGVQGELARLVAMQRHELQIEWRRQFRSAPPARLSQDLLRRAIAYKLQERAQGGLNQATKKMLRDLAGKIAAEGASGALGFAPAIKPGVQLVRDWHGQAHSVRVLEDGFDYQGQRYRSLTEIAKKITGAHWSGPRFFGVISVRPAGETSPARRVGGGAIGVDAHGQA